MRWFLKFIFFGAASMALLTTCKTNQQADRSGTGVLSEEETGDLANRIEQIKKVYYSCPSPAEMLSVIEISKLGYRDELLNAPGNADAYLDMKGQTLNLGIYITDLAYTALFGRHQETLEYIEIVQSLSEKVRVTGAISDELIQRVRDNVNNLDTLFNISNEAFMNMLSYCEKNSRPNTIVLLSGGAFVESLFLAVNMVGKYNEADYLINHLTEQKYALENLVAFAESMPGDESVAGMLNDIQPVREIYEKLESGGLSTTVKKESDNKLVIGGGKKILLSEEDFNKLKQETLRLRNRITGNTGS